MARKHRRLPQQVLCSDLDGTLFREMQHALLMEECFLLGVFEKEDEDAYRDAYLARRDRRISYDRYEGELVEFMLQRLTGLSTDHIERAAKSLAERHKDYVYTFTSTLLKVTASTHKRVAITGTIKEIADIIGPLCGFDEWYATRMERANGMFTGKQLHVPPFDKRAVVNEYFARTGLSRKGSIAIGDTGSDISMLDEVEVPIAFNPNDALADAAERNGWPIVLERKDNIYVISGNTSRRFLTTHAAAAVRHVLYL